MRKILFCFAFCAAALTAGAQIAEVSTPQPILKGTESRMYYPVLSADGSQMLFSDDNHSNLRMYDFDDNVTVKITATPAESFRAHFTADGQVSLKRSDKAPVSVDVDGSRLLVSINGVTDEYTPVDAYAGYCWPSLSPDGTKVMFVAAGKGIVITDLRGNIISRPGTSRMEAPVWFGNSHIVAMLTTDDGHQISSSQIVMMTVDGKVSQNLTKPESMSMFPSASAEAGKVVYNTVDGRMYQINVTLK